MAGGSLASQDFVALPGRTLRSVGRGDPFQPRIMESPNGRSLFFASTRAGGQGGIDIWVARRSGGNDAWGAPANLPAPVNSAYNDFCPTPPGGELLFVSTRPGGCGDGTSDIYRTRLHPTDGWLEPEHLGCEVNSAGDEFSPSYVGAGGGALFFSSDRDGGPTPTVRAAREGMTSGRRPGPVCPTRGRHRRTWVPT